MARAGCRPAGWCIGVLVLFFTVVAGRVVEKGGLDGLGKPPSSSSSSPRPSHYATPHSQWHTLTLKHTPSLSHSWEVVLIAAAVLFIFFGISIFIGCLCCKKLEDSTLQSILSGMWVNAKTKLYGCGKNTKTKIYGWGKKAKSTWLGAWKMVEPRRLWGRIGIWPGNICSQ